MSHLGREITLTFFRYSDFKYGSASVLTMHCIGVRELFDGVCYSESIEFVSLDYAIKTVTNTMLRFLSVGNLFNVFATYLRFRRFLAFITYAKTTGSSIIFTDQTERSMFWLFQGTANSVKCEPSCTCLTLHKQNVRNKISFYKLGNHSTTKFLQTNRKTPLKHKTASNVCVSFKKQQYYLQKVWNNSLPGRDIYRFLQV